MKKLMIIVLVIILTGIILYGLYNLCLKRTPEKLLKQTFNICLTGFDYTIDTFEEKWYPNGDGYALIIYKFNELTEENIDYLKKFNVQPLPISETIHLQMLPNKLPQQYSNANIGFYIYKPESTIDYRNFKFFMIDTERKVAILYYQYM